MASEKALYWMAVGVLALMVGDHFASKLDGKCLEQRALASVQWLANQANHSMALAGATVGRISLPWAHAESSMAGVEARLASVQNAMARQEAACARLQGQRAQMRAMQGMRQLRVICPRQDLHVEIPEIQIPQPVVRGDEI